MTGPTAENVHVVPARSRRDLDGAALALDEEWPAFMTKDPASRRLLENIDRLTDWLFYVVADRPDDGPLVGRVMSVPWHWPHASEQLPSRGWDAAIDLGLACVQRSLSPTDACALEITLASDVVGRGISAQCVAALRTICAERGLGRLFAPVRPTSKADEPETPFKEFVERRRDDGLAADPWVRVHERLGASIEGVAPLSMTISGTLEDWKAWTGLELAEDQDRFIVPGGLAPVLVDRGEQVGCYIEPNLWMCHDL